MGDIANSEMIKAAVQHASTAVYEAQNAGKLRDLSIAVTHLETAILWLQRAAAFAEQQESLGTNE